MRNEFLLIAKGIMIWKVVYFLLRNRLEAIDDVTKFE